MLRSHMFRGTVSIPSEIETVCAGHKKGSMCAQTESSRCCPDPHGHGSWHWHLGEASDALGNHGRVSLRERTQQPRGCEFAASDPDRRAAPRRALYSAPDETRADQPSGLGPSFRPRWEAMASSIICKGSRLLPIHVSLSPTTAMGQLFLPFFLALLSCPRLPAGATCLLQDKERRSHRADSL
jgi:hypothetical protein